MRFLFSNPLINVCTLAWLSAQLIKTLVALIKHRKFDKSRLAGAGGMPSSHSAVVCAAVLTACLEYGFTSPIFALSFVLALIVMYDATGVRWAAGLHARAINKIVAYLGDTDNPDKDAIKALIPKLNESLGHRVIEVICGAILGIFLALVAYVLRGGQLPPQ